MRKRSQRFGVALLVGLLFVPWHSSRAQEQGSWDITPRLGIVFWDEAGAIQDPVLNRNDCDFPELNHDCAAVANSLMAGLSAHYGVTQQLSVGLAFDVARPVTNGTYFPPAEIEIAGQQELTFVNQRLTVLQYAIEGEWAPAFARLSPFVLGSVGGYTVYKDAPKADQAGVTGAQTFTDFMLSVGAGLDFAFGPASGFRLEVRDMIYTGWDREELNPVDDRFQSDLFPDLVPAPPEDSSTLHNFRLSLGFFFVPGGGS